MLRQERMCETNAIPAATLVSLPSELGMITVISLYLKGWICLPTPRQA